MITLSDGFADADVTVNGGRVAPRDVTGGIEVIMPEDGAVRIVVESEQAMRSILKGVRLALK